jgi:hypothetical protein
MGVKCDKPIRNNLAGKRFSRLFVVSLFQRKPVYWECLCDCGNRLRVKPDRLKSGMTKSCGCLRKEMSAQRLRKRPFESLYLLFLSHRTRDPSTKLHLFTDISYEDFLGYTDTQKCHYCSGPV